MTVHRALGMFAAGRVKPVPTPDGPLSRFLLDPEGALKAFLRRLLDALPIVLAVVGVAALVFLLWRLWLVRRARHLREGARRIRVQPASEIDPQGARTLWMGLHALLRPWWRRLTSGQPYLAWEITATPEDVEVSLWVPNVVPPGLVERAVEASWPGARAEAAPADRLGALLGSGAVETTELALAEPEWLPIGETPGSDPLTLGLAALRGLAEGEAAAIQVLAEPATSRARRRLVRAARSLRAGTRMAWRAGRGPAARRPAPDPAVEGDVRAVLAKAGSPLWRCLLRVAVVSPQREQARGRIHGLAGAFAVFEARNGFRRRRGLDGAGAMAGRRLRRPYLLSVPELAQIANLPALGALPGLEAAAARTVPPPSALPVEGNVLGEADHPGIRRRVALNVEDLRHHVHVIGETGTGKSTLLANLVLQDAEAGRSAVVIDPKGDLVGDIMARLPAGAEERTCVLDPDDTRWAVGLNALAGGDTHLVVDHIAAAFKRIFEQYWGPRTDDIMRAACLTLKQVPGATVAEIPTLLMHPEARQAVYPRIQHMPTLGAFWDLYEEMRPEKRQDHILPLMNKLRQFLLRGPLLPILGQPHPKLDVANLLDRGGLLLVRIPKGTLGENTSRLLGAFVVAQVWQACMSRARSPEAQRPDTTLYVDEMHNYLALPKSFEDLLAEARGYRLSLVLAHQHLGQLPREMRDALAANARTKLAFACSPTDTRVLEEHFQPLLTSHDLSNLAAFQAACRPSLGAGRGAPFTFRTMPLPKPDPRRAERVREASASAFAEPREAVETDIQLRLARFEAGEWKGGEQSVAQPVAQPVLQSVAQPGSSQVSGNGSAGGEG